MSKLKLSNISLDENNRHLVITEVAEFVTKISVISLYYIDIYLTRIDDWPCGTNN